jgi:hypothetical protein
VGIDKRTPLNLFLFRNPDVMDNPAQMDIPADTQDDTFHDIDDPHDTNYIEPTVPAHATKITPHQRKGFAEEFSAAAKKRVDKVDGKRGRCVVTNTPAFNGVQYAHLLPRAAKSALVCYPIPTLPYRSHPTLNFCCSWIN